MTSVMPSQPEPVQLPVPQPPYPAPRHVSYWAISIFSSRTAWLNAAAFLVTVSEMTEVTSVIPPRYMPMFGMLVALANLYLRTKTVRPAGFVCSGADVTLKLEHPLVKAVEVEPNRSRPMPYEYAFVRAIAPNYLRVPTKAEQFQYEMRLERHLRSWSKLAKKWDGLDVGADYGSPVSEEYPFPFPFTGNLESVTIDLE